MTTTRSRTVSSPCVSRVVPAALSVLVIVLVGTVWAHSSRSVDVAGAAGIAEESPPAGDPDVPRPGPEPIAAFPAGSVIEVPDPRPGDLRVDQGADTLPAGYDAGSVGAPVEVAYGRDPAQRIDLYLPPGPESVPVVVFLHSGGWVAGDKAHVPPFVLRFVERGYAVASVGYRLAPHHAFPAQLHDVKNAIRWLKSFGAGSDSIDGDRLVLLGTSAGGHLAALAAATPGTLEPPVLSVGATAFDSSVTGVVSVVGPTDLVDFYRSDAIEGGRHPWRQALPEALLGCAPCREPELLEASPTTYLARDLPPAYWVYGQEDTTLVAWDEQGREAARAWGEHAGRGSSWFDLVEGAAHNIDQTSINQRELERFVDRVVARP